MHRILLAAGLLPLLAGGMDLRFHYSSAAFPNLIYNIACLAGNLPCTKEAYEKLWHGELDWNAHQDDRQIEVWAKAVKKAAGDGQIPKAPFLGNYLAFYPNVAGRERLIGAALEAGSTRELGRRLKGLARVEEVAALSAVLDHFAARYHKWWVAKRATQLRTHLRQVDRNIRRDGMAPLAGQIAAFMEARLATPDVYVFAIVRPDQKSTESIATVLTNHFFVEIVGQDKPEDTEWKAMHELTHYFYATAPLEKHLAFMNEFLKTGREDAPPLYGFVNEAVATAVQLMIYQRKHIAETAPYDHPFIPRLGKSTLPLLKQALSEKATLFTPNFAESYIRAGEAGLGETVRSPRFLLSSVALLPSGKTEKAATGTFFREFGPSFYLRREGVAVILRSECRTVCHLR